MRCILQSLISVSALVVSANALAGPLQLERVAADVQWVAHLDVEGLANSQLVQFVLKNGKEFDIEIDDFNSLKERFGIDPFYDLKDITLYGQGYDDEPKFVAIVTASPAIDAFIETLRAEGGEERTRDIAGYTVHSFDADGKTLFLHVRPGAAESRRVIVVSPEAERLVRAISVVEGRSPNLKQAPHSLLNQNLRQGSLLFAAAVDIPGDRMEENNPASGIVRDTKAAMFNFGEVNDQTEFELMIETATGETATNVSDVIRGFLAMGKIAVNSEPELQPLKNMLNAVKLATQQSAVTIKFQQPTTSLIETLRTLASHDDDADDADDDSDEDEDEDKD